MLGVRNSAVLALNRGRVGEGGQHCGFQQSWTQGGRALTHRTEDDARMLLRAWPRPGHCQNVGRIQMETQISLSLSLSLYIYIYRYTYIISYIYIYIYIV